MSLKDNSVILSDSANNSNCNITLGDETPKPILSSTTHKSRNSKSSRNDLRESYIPVPKNYRGPISKRTSVGSSNSSNESAFNDDSSLSILDLDELPDARKSVSLVHISDKASSIGSWLDSGNYIQGNDDKENCENFSSNHPLHRGKAVDLDDFSFKSDQLRLSEVNRLESSQHELKAPFDATSNGSDDSDFEFNEEELDIDVLINEDNELDSTMKDDQFSEDQGKDTIEGNSTTLDFLKGIGFPLKSMQGNNSTLTGNDSSNKLDSRYFAAASVQSQLSINDTNTCNEDSLRYSVNNKNDHTQSTDMASLDEKFLPPRTSTCDQPFNNWENMASPLDFSTHEFVDDFELQQPMLEEEEFHSNSSGDALAMFEKDEEMVKKEHEFSIAEDFVAKDTSNLDFSTFRTSMMTVDQEEEAGKVSIGRYMAERSGKLGHLDGKYKSERPSFGLKVRTPSPQKPYTLVCPDNASTTIPRNDHPTTVADDSLPSSAYSDTMLSKMALDDTVDQSMMKSLSNAISNMSTNMNNEDLAKFIVALSNKKIEKDKVKNKQTFIAEVKPDRSTLVGTDDLKADGNGNTTTLGDKSKDLGNTAKSFDSVKEKSAMVLKNEIGPNTPRFSEADELPSWSENETLLSPDSIASKLLSSTRLNLSLARGSLSRESIEELHKKLRGNIPSLKELDMKNWKLPDVVTTQSSGTSSGEDKKSFKSKNDLHSEGKSLLAPLSESSPDEPLKQGKYDDMRLSSMFHPLHPSTSFMEMPTIDEDGMPGKQFENTMVGDGKKQVDETKHDLSTLSSVEHAPKASSTHAHESDFQSDKSSLNTRSSVVRTRLSEDIVCPPHYASLPAGMGNYDFYQRQHLMGLQTMPPHQFGKRQSYNPDARGFDSTVFSTRSVGYPPIYPQAMMGGRVSGGYPPQEIYYEGPSVSVQPELTHDKKLCTSVPMKMMIPVKNNSPRWIQVELRTISVALNNRTILSGQDNFVSLKRKHVIGPHALEHCDVTLTSNDPGHCHVVVEILSHLISVEGITPHDPRCSVSPIHIHAEVEFPKVVVFASTEIPTDCQKKEAIDFGEIVCGSTKAVPLRILNRGKCEVPIRAILFTNSHERSCFSLSLSSTSSSKQESSSTLAVLRLVLPVSDQPITIWIHFQSPMKQFASGDLPEKVKGRIEVTLDVPVQSGQSSQSQTSLDAINLQALVGVGKLHASSRPHLFVFKAPPGGNQMQKFPVKNAGNISVQVSFSLQENQNLFTIRPSNALLPPSGELNVSVEFHPPQGEARGGKPFTSLLLMMILPSGPQFEVKLTSTITHNLNPAPDTPTLLTNKTRLRWGGVLIGSSSKQKLMLRKSKVDSGSKVNLKFRASIKGDDSGSFQIVTTDYGCEELCARSDMIMEPGSDKSIFISFAPCKRKMVHAKLEIKTPIDDLPATKYTIPLTGYGGISQVTLNGLNQVDEIYELNLDLPSFSLSNNGTRSAFVKILVYRDKSCQDISEDIRCSFSCFVLQEKQMKKLSIENSNNQSGYICIWHGDELSRQLMKGVVTDNPSLVKRCIPQSLKSLQSVSFTEHFMGEEQFREEDTSKLEHHSYDAQLFYDKIKCIKIMCCPPHTPDVISSVSSSSVSSFSSLDSSVNKPERDIGSSLIKKVNITQRSVFTPNWEVTPTHITVEAPTQSGVPEATKVKIINKSHASMLFDIIWPGHYITITPNRGKVEPESVMILLVSANPSLSSQLSLLPWCGQAMVVSPSGDESCVIHVQIKSPESSLTSLSSCDSASSDTLVPVETPCVRLKNNVIEFADVISGNSSKSLLEFRNMSKSDIKWSITSFAPAYVKNTDLSGDVFRSTYAVFVFSQTSGQLEVGARVQIPVTFNPMHGGLYSQHWELEYHFVSDASGLSLQQDKFQLNGKAVKQIEKGNSLSPKLCRGDIYISKESFQFPSVKVGESKTIKIPVKNKGKSAHTVKFMNLRQPFYITHQKHTIRAMHCANLPVTFKPTNHGSYTGTLVVQSEAGGSIQINISGSTA
ncbi:centrosomal protein of 192 kDa [Ciona intestinalis]